MSQRDGIIDIWGPRTPTAQGVPWPARLDSNGEVSPERWVQSACVLCSNGCGLDIGVSGGRIVGVRGRVADRVNRGRLGPKGLNAWVANNSEDRLTRPLVRREGRLEPTSWDEAMCLIVDHTRTVREKATANAIGFYTSGQLFLEEYYTLAVIGKAGLGTPHMDGNTRLCTATAGQALKETFGSDGQPASYTDIEATDALFLVGHNMAATQTVLWSRILDRRRGPNPPKLVVIDPRATPTAREADVHLAPAVGTNVAVLNGLLALIIESGQIDAAFIETRTIGFGSLHERVRSYTPERVHAISGVPVETLRAAARILGGTPTLLSTCLQGVYQSMQATAAAVQVNNLNLIRGLIGHPGSGVLQMNGQPTAQNTRESGANGDMPAFRNWNNPKHIAELAELWNVEIDRIPHWAPPTHASQIFRYCETGSIQMLWISATNPLVSMPDLNRMRRILGNPALFLVVQDAFLTETAQLADVVLPAAIWGEKTGCFTNVDRTVHISHKAVEPPGEARADLDILLDFAQRMGLRDQDGMPLIKWSDAEGAFNAWRECTRGKRCDYSGLSYAKLSEGSGIQWPCNDLHPGGTERLYSDHVFPTQPDTCEDYGHDLDTGAQVSRERYMDVAANGRAILKSADWRPPQEMPDADFPFMLTTGRVAHHFHTRTKTGRSEKLNAAAPDAFVQLAEEDARQLGIIEGEAVRVTSRRGHIIVAAKVGEILRGHVFVPFHYGYWDGDGCARAANELTILEWDPVSKQPHFKYAAVRIEKSMFADGAVGEAGDTSSRAAPGQHLGQPKRAHVADYIGLLHASEDLLCRAFKQIRDVHASEPDIASITTLFEAWSADARTALMPFIEKYGERVEGDPGALADALVRNRRPGGFALMRGLQDLWLATNESFASLTILLQAAHAIRDERFVAVLSWMQEHNERQRAWLTTRIKQMAAQTLLAPVPAPSAR